MKIDREIGSAPKTVQLGQQIASMREPCVGCEGCKGLCAALIEMVTLPDAILDRERSG